MFLEMKMDAMYICMLTDNSMHIHLTVGVQLGDLEVK